MVILQKTVAVCDKKACSNQEGDACAFCKEHKGVIPIGDGKTPYWICEKCDNEMDWEPA